MTLRDTILTKKASSPAMPTVLWWVGIALLCVILSLRPVDDPDIWFQLLAGRYALQHGAVPHHEFFLYTAAGARQLFGGWGFGLLAELAVRLGGWTGLSVFNALIWAATFCLGLLAAQRAASRSVTSGYRVDIGQMAAMALVLLVVYPTFLHRSQMRAEVTLYLAWMAAALMFENCLHPTRIRRALLGFPLICLGLAWVHTTVLLLLPLLAAYAIRRWQRRHDEAISRNEAVWWGLCGLASVVLPMLNPNGVQQVFAQFSAWKEMQAAGNLPTEGLSIREYLPLWDPSSSFLWPSAAVLTLGTAVWLVAAGPARLPGFIAIAPMVVMAMQHRRGLGLWAMALLVPLASSLIEAFGRCTRHKPMQVTMGTLTALSILVLMAAVLPSRYWGIGMADVGLRATEVVKLIARIRPNGGNIWMLDAVAPQVPYLLGDTYKVGYAGHMIYRHPSAINHYTAVWNAAGDWEKELANHDVTLIGVTSLQLPDAELIPLAVHLAWHSQWQLTGIDRQMLVFRKRDASETVQPQDQWTQASAFTAHALQMAQASQLLSPDPKKLALIQRLEQQRAVLIAAKDQPERVNWIATAQLSNMTGSTRK